MAYKCLECGYIFDEPYTYRECIGEFWGAPAYDTFSVSPCCNADYDEVEDSDD